MYPCTPETQKSRRKTRIHKSFLILFHIVSLTKVSYFCNITKAPEDNIMTKNLKQWIRIAGTVAMAYVISHFLIYDISSISYFKPMEKTKELAITDFYQIVSNRKNVKPLEQNIAIVSIDSCGRREIAQLLEAIDFCNPAAVGLDVFFNYPSADDSLLISAIEECNNIVLPCSTVYDKQSGT